ncbi:MAG: putative ABC transporter permease [Spirochaetes bacterium]|nr:putative ABC transporter permease [Spirochaetota bacterium]
MNKNGPQYKKLLTIYILAGIIYVFIEVVFTAISGKILTLTKYYERISLIGLSSIWMFPIGGFLGIVLGLLNEWKLIKHWKMIFQALLGCLIITGIELISGIVLNRWLDLKIWDYTELPFNYLGQINLFHSIGWFFLSPVAFWFDDFIRAEMYGEGKVYSLLEPFKKLFTLH